MNAFQDMAERYRRDHTHPVNKATHMVGIPLILVSLPLLLAAPSLGATSFVVGWIFQLVGHAFEGKRPSFLRDPRFLVVGAAWYGRRLWSLVRGEAPASSA